MNRLSQWALVLGIITAVGCSKPPTIEMTDAENAVNAAEQAGALEYATADFQTAQNALADAKAKLEAKDYAAARAAALDARIKAEAASAAVDSGKSAARARAETAIAEVESQVKSLKAQAAKAKGEAAAKGKAAIKALEADWYRIKEDFLNGSYAKVNAAVDIVREQVSELAAEIRGERTEK